MTKTRIFASALLTVASLGTMSAANAVVPGSDTVERARDGAAVQSVIEGSASAGGAGATASQSTYGFPLGAAPSNGALVPGSRSVETAAERDAVMSVINGTPEGTFTAVPTPTGRIVPGSDSF